MTISQPNRLYSD